MPDGIMNYHNAGKVRLRVIPRICGCSGCWTSHYSDPEESRSILVIGCGAGVTAGRCQHWPTTEHVTIAEIEPSVPSVVSKYFGDYNYNVVRSKVRLVIDDGRHFLETTREKFDEITSILSIPG